MSDAPQSDLDQSLRFLEWLTPGGPWVLTAIPPEGGRTTTETFTDPARARAWLEERTGVLNLYFAVNPLKAATNKKAKKEDVAELAFLHVDVDPRKAPDGTRTEDLPQWYTDEQARISKLLADFAPTPSAIIFSGGGYQAFWRLGQPLYLGGAEAQIADAEAYNRQLEIILSGDHCRNVDRILRVPGTVNIPDVTKRKRGRKAALATIVSMTSETYDLADFTPAPPEDTPANGQAGSAPQERSEIQMLDDPASLESWGVPPWVGAVVVEGTDPTEPDRWGGNRSDAVFAVACELIRHRVPPGLIAGILQDPTWGISAHVRDKGGRDVVGYAWRQVERARAKVSADGDPFETDKHGIPFPSQRNIRLALTKMGVRVRHDRFADRAALAGLDGFGPHLNDAALTRLRLRAEEEHKLKVGKEFFCDVVEDAARRDDFHPVVDYLDGLAWDGNPRLDGWMTTYMQAADNDYTRHVGTILLVAAVRRVRQPGCKFDEMVVLESEQGKAKSSALAVLAVHEDWFNDDLPLNAEAKLVIERTQGRWIIEAGELKGMSPKGVEHLKGFLSRRRDSSRMAYGRLTHDAPRHFIVVGTTNDDKYLVDSTGNRRFWPVRVGDIDLDALARDRDQLWAEAAVREASGESIRLDKGLWQAAALEQDERRTLDPFVAPLADLFHNLQGKVRSSDVWNFIGTPIGMRTPEQERRLGVAMRDLGFERVQLRFGGDPEWCYRRGDDEQRRRRIFVEASLDDKDRITSWDAFLERDDTSSRQSAMDLGPKVGDDPY